MTTATPSRPVIVIVPGAWHTRDHYKILIDLLEAKGYEISIKQNASCESTNPHEQSVESDTSTIRDELLLPVINAGRDVVLVMHSYGGCPGAAAAVGLSKVERLEQGQNGGIIGLAFICAFVANEGDSLVSKLPGQTFESWHKLLDDGQIAPDRPKEIFYADVPGPLDEAAIAALRLQSRASFEAKSPPPAWPQAVYDGRRSYLQCTEDQAIPFIGQKMMVEYSGVTWNTTEMKSSHSPFLSHPQETADWLDQQAAMFMIAT